MGIDAAVISGTHGPTTQGSVSGVPVTFLGHELRVSQTYISLGLPAALLTKRLTIFHAHFPCPWWTEWAVLAGKLRRIPTVVTYHNDPGKKEGILGLLTQVYSFGILPMSLRLADRIIVTTPERALRSQVLRRARCGDKQVLIPLGVNSDRLRPKRPLPKTPVIGFLGLLRSTHYYKGVDVLLEAAAILRRRGISFKLCIGGEGQLRPIFEAKARELGLEECTRFLGYVPEENLVDFYNALSVFVLPSTDSSVEGFGLVALEAMACGRPVVVSAAAGVAPFVRERGAGKVVPPRDPVALADALTEVLTDTGYLDNLAKRARRAAEERSWRRAAEMHLALYKELLAAAGEPVC
jgi:glycosyltransferase involved in cell wall biosynthesis